MNIWKVNKATGLPFTPAGYVWELFFEPEKHPTSPYHLLMKGRGEKESWYRAGHLSRIVWRGDNPATGSTIRPRHIRKAARHILREHLKYEKARAENENGNPTIQPGEYPPNRL